MTTVIRKQDEIEVFVNKNGSVTIKQHCPDLGEQIVVFWYEHAERLCAAIEAAASEAEADAILGRSE